MRSHDGSVCVQADPVVGGVVGVHDRRFGSDDGWQARPRMAAVGYAQERSPIVTSTRSTSRRSPAATVAITSTVAPVGTSTVFQ